jgi:hypothetical protein
MEELVGEYEEDARRIISKVLGVPVIQNDHNVGRSVPDLYIDYPDRPRAYVEVTSDGVQGAWRALDRELHKRGYELKVAGLTYDWWVFPAVKGQIKKLWRGLPSLLRRLEQDGETFGHWRDGTLKQRIQDSRFHHEIAQLGIDELVAGSVATGDAVVRFAPPGAGGPAELDLDYFLEWCDNFLANPANEHNLQKLANTDASERHEFIVVNIVSDWAVQHVLSRDGYPRLPKTAPNLPHEVTHLWLLGAGCLDRCIAWLPDRGGWIDYANGPWHSST